ncbi:hypothetical protein [Streptomyces sp. NPDC056304]|uniref:hypothetical protein n=1 Tax=Streptomyces sp. NPDC056304 TaxID=3345778 RepID=UPI0035DFF8D4
MTMYLMVTRAGMSVVSAGRPLVPCGGAFVGEVRLAHPQYGRQYLADALLLFGGAVGVRHLAGQLVDGGDGGGEVLADTDIDPDSDAGGRGGERRLCVDIADPVLEFYPCGADGGRDPAQENAVQGPRVGRAVIGQCRVAAAAASPAAAVGEKHRPARAS